MTELVILQLLDLVRLVLILHTIRQCVESAWTWLYDVFYSGEYATANRKRGREQE